MTLPPRIDVTRSQITEIVETFYSRARDNETLGPIFAAHVTDWPEHEAKIVRFWANAILHERAYDGNPMQVHLQAGNVHSAHFPVWLALFDQILSDKLPVKQARQWSNLAHRIGQGLAMGVDEYRRPADTVPNLTSGF